MSVAIANALIVNSPLSIDQLDVAFRHYEQLSKLLIHSGPRFGSAREDAKYLGNIALSRMRGEREREAQARRIEENDDGLVEIA